MNLDQLIQSQASPLLMAVVAFVLGALHGLEPGHSKTMMAAYIIAIRGTVTQAALLGLSAALSHSVIVWILAYIGLTFGNEWIAGEMEGWFMMASGLIIILLAVWVFWRIEKESGTHHSVGYDYHHRHSHDHDDAGSHVRRHAAELKKHFTNNGVAGQGRATTGQIVLFGLTGGLMPCAAAVTVLIICLHLDKLSLGLGLVSAFSIGLAIVMVAAGVIAALGTAYVSRRSIYFNTFMSRAPYLSAGVMAVIGLIMIVSGTHY